ncbi:hypothetical protein [Rhodococcoides kyotonense]|uniref:Uncharacterized protein n=1 Tax=Rhodococcoides kyotonense TaxID=398843 RepID=A0A239MP38_9NOCA|nr:hypothetical protein [Rhodococcus kyotonensis]SNT43748.1 hypothetical protein SAMN05421642_11986 [Rhodococcus kyotonensis]
MDYDAAPGGERPGGGHGVDEAVAAALSYLDSVDPATAADARTGWEGLSLVSPVAGPTQNSLQTFLWLHLRVLSEDFDRAWDIAQALADLLDRLGHGRYADIARSSRTHELLVAPDDETWHRRYGEAVADSGIGAEDTELVSWQDAPEGAERAIVELIGETLEVATVAGEFAPKRLGGPPLRPSTLAMRRRGITDSVLRSERAGGVLLEQLLDHRIVLWTQYSPPRAELYRDLAGQLHDSAEPAYGCVRKVEGLLAAVGDGVTTAESAGLLQRLGLVRKHRGRLVPTARARDISADRMWTTLVGKLIGTEYHPDAVAAEVVLAEVARGTRPHGTAMLTTALLRAEGWTHDAAADELLDDLTAVGAFSRDGEPSPDGIRLAAAVLRHRLLHTRLDGCVIPPHG